MSQGEKFRTALLEEKPLQIIGVMNAYVAILAKSLGFKALYLSGAAVSNFSFGLPDMGLTSMDNLLEETRRITAVVDLPLLVDIDTGWDTPIQIQRCIKGMEHAGAAGLHIEDQVLEKKCGHLPGKQIISIDKMVQRIEAATEARTDKDFVIMARSDAYATEGLDRVIERCRAYHKAGADMVFPEALPSLEDFRAFRKAIDVPFLANLTEFGQTALISAKKLGSIGVDMVLYPLSASRAMNQTALKVMQDIRTNGTQLLSLDAMQTRQELYHFLEYDKYKKREEKWLRED
jgi:methylisocitrate lyase